MLLLLSPAKTLDYETPVPAEVLARSQEPRYAARSAELIRVLKKLSPEDVAGLMHLSPALAQLNVDRYRKWRRSFGPSNSKPAALAFNGDVYEGLDAKTLKPSELDWVQEHVVILSGLYGVLRPLDALQPYRLEMGTPLATARGKDLYDFWGTTIAEYLDGRLSGGKSPMIVNLASQEYFKAVDRSALKAPVIECVFEDYKGGRYKVISFFAKRARGLMARYAAARRARTPQVLQQFDVDGYAFDEEASQAQRWVFRRRIVNG
ncbi:MAG TPA: peroxide stress protein YaaA [Burkholderiaceae bacterium]|nr:peroxide stress protein YaaA [Burkholderiaceae bacterium]